MTNNSILVPFLRLSLWEDFAIDIGKVASECIADIKWNRQNRMRDKADRRRVIEATDVAAHFGEEKRSGDPRR